MTTYQNFATIYNNEQTNQHTRMTKYMFNDTDATK